MDERDQDIPNPSPLEKTDAETKGSKILFVMPTEREMEVVDQKMSNFRANKDSQPLPPIDDGSSKNVLPPKSGVAKPVPKAIPQIKKEEGANPGAFSLAPRGNADAINRKHTAGKVVPSDTDQFFDNPPPPADHFGAKKSRSANKIYPAGDDGSEAASVDDEADKKSTHSKGSRKSGDKKSTHSADSWGSGSSASGRGGKQLSDTRVRKLLFMRDSFFSVILLAIFAYGLAQLSSPTGMVLPFNAYDFHAVGPIVTILWARIAYIVTDTAFTKGIASYLGWRLCSKEGYSVAGIGFMHAGLFEQLSFANILSFRSTCKPFLSKLALLNLLHAIMLLITCLTSSAVGAFESRINKGALMCILYDQVGIGFPWDRGLPTITSSMGVAELVDGEALGIAPNHDGSIVHLFSPQLIDVCQDGSTIIGNGFATNVSSECMCSPSMQSADLATVTGLDSSITSDIAARAAVLGAFPGMVNFLVYDNSTDDGASLIQMYTLLTGSSFVCGAPKNSSFSITTSPAPICLTNITDHHQAEIKVTYKTDGTPASIAARKAEYLSYVDSADTWWLAQSMLNLFGGQISSNDLPPYLPGLSNPLLWFATTDSQSVDLTLLPSGIQAFMAIMLRSSMQRSYNTYGSFCTQEIIDPLTVTLRMDHYGYLCGVIWVVYEFIVVLVSFLLYIPWWLSDSPILPAIEAFCDPIIFAVHTTKNDIILARIKALSSNVESAVVWSRLDMVLRMGESTLTSDDPDRGVLVLDRPRMVTDLSFSKLYI